jgi:hypothetical protein
MNDGEWVTDTPVYGVPVPSTTYAVSYYTSGSNTYNNNPTFEQSPTSTGSFGIDHNNGFNVVAGDNVVVSCWIKTAGSDAGLSWGGAWIGFDIRTYENGFMQEADSVCSSWAAENGGDPTMAHNADSNSFVPYGSGWTLITWDFTVQTRYAVNSNYSIGSGPTLNQFVNGVQQYATGPFEIAPWCLVLDSNYWASGSIAYPAWFSDYQLYINP